MSTISKGFKNILEVLLLCRENERWTLIFFLGEEDTFYRSVHLDNHEKGWTENEIYSHVSMTCIKLALGC